MTTLQRRVALVTGGAAGLGAAFAARLATDGFAMAIADLEDAGQTVAGITEAGGVAEGYHCDVADPRSVAELRDAVGERQGVVSVLVNNAGIYPLIPWNQMTYEQWRQIHAVNLDSMFLTTKAFVPDMIETGWGRVVNITSGSGWIPSRDFSAYVTSKLGVVGYTRGLAIELGDTGITVNAIAPSLVRTATIENSEHATFFEEIAQLQAIHRVQEPADLVGTLSYLVSDDAAFMTGQTLSIDGGYVRL